MDIAAIRKHEGEQRPACPIHPLYGREKELTSWAVALIGGGRGRLSASGTDISVDMLQRAAHGQYQDRYSIGRLMSPRDEAIDLDDRAWTAALAETRRAFHADPGRNGSQEEPDAPNGPAISGSAVLELTAFRPVLTGASFSLCNRPGHCAGENAGLPPDPPPAS